MEAFRKPDSAVETATNDCQGRHETAPNVSLVRGFEAFELEKYFAIHEFSAKYLLSSADAQSMSMKDLLALANESERHMWENLWLGYTETQGLPILRQHIVDSFYPTLTPENILCFAGWT